MVKYTDSQKSREGTTEDGDGLGVMIANKMWKWWQYSNKGQNISIVSKQC